MTLGPACTVVDSGGIPVKSVESGAPAMTVVESGGIAVTLSDDGAPFILDGLGPDIGPELWAQPAFDASTGLTLNDWTVAGGEANNNFSATFMSATSLDTLVAGNYQIEGEFGADVSGSLLVQIGGDTGKLIPAVTGVFSVTHAVASVSTQVIRMRESQGDPIVLTSFSVKQVL